MPIYEYQCQQCHKLFEFLEKVSATPKIICPDCQTPTLKKQVSLSAFQLKGTGWYQTDFKHSNKQAPDKEKKTDTDTKTAAAGSKEKKPSDAVS
jgi:putative FmdB family regulatory protein